jgi:hypothetical protein
MSDLPEIDTTKPHAARIYDYYLGGKDNFTADRTVAEQVIASWPEIRAAARENRAFIGRAIRYLVAEAGIGQFLDIGSGLPTANNVHEVAQGANSSARVVYVDNDPIVHAHSRVLLASSPQGRCAYIHADLREPEKIISDPVVRETLDFSRPIALILAAVVHFLSDEDEPERIIGTLVDALLPGSYVVATHGTPEYSAEESAGGLSRAYQRGGVSVHLRDSGEFGRLVFSGLDLLPPGVIATPLWRPDEGSHVPLPPSEAGTNAAVGRKP